ncbi:MAG: carboxypeptidase-like regulatory domain-containing protein, partial [Pseudomonadota bacterium]
TLRLRAVDEAGNATISDRALFIGEQINTALSLEPSALSLLPSASTQDSNRLTITGKLRRLSDDAGMAGQDIQISISGPAPSETIVLGQTVSTDTNGDYRISDIDVLMEEGEYKIQASFSGFGLLNGSNSSEITVGVGQSAGYAILVQGRNAIAEGLQSHKKTLNRVYRTLLARGFAEDNIRYFAYPTSGLSDDINDVIMTPNKAEIEESITTWAMNKLRDVPAPLYLIMIDHGSRSAFLLDEGNPGNDEILPAELNSWMTTMETALSTTKPEALDRPRVVVLGHCYSGNFLSHLSAPNRLLISSATADEESFKGPEEGDGFPSGEFFIEELFLRLKSGQNFREAFRGATVSTEELTFRGGNSSADDTFNDGALQHPLLDDNGDRRASNILSLNGDGNLAGDLFLGVGPSTNAGNDTQARITDVTPVRLLDAQTNNTPLFLSSNAPDRVESAWVEIRLSQSALALRASNLARSEQLEINRERVFLSRVNNSNRFELDLNIPGNRDRFGTPGRYEVFYFIKDFDRTVVTLAPSRRSIVYKNKPAADSNRAPFRVNLISPAANAETNSALVFDWSDALDPDNDPLTYLLLIASEQTLDPDTSNLDIESDSIVFRHEYTLSMAGIGESVLQRGATFYWQVLAIDTFGAIASEPAEIRSFKTTNTNTAPGITTIKANSALPTQPLTFNPIVNASMNQQPPVSLGNETILTLPGAEDVDITVSALNHQTCTFSHQAASGSEMELPIDLPSEAHISTSDFILHLPLVRVAGGGEALFSVDLQFDGAAFALSNLATASPVAECNPTTFDPASGIVDIPIVIIDGSSSLSNEKG